jgi:mono/diheme cytochrome c family protein
MKAISSRFEASDSTVVENITITGNNKAGIRTMIRVRFAALFACTAILLVSQGQHALDAQTPAATAIDAQGAASYASHCAMCHGKQREGNPPVFPSLLNVKAKLNDSQITDLIHKGKAPMPAFPEIKDAELVALLHFLTASDIAPAPPAPPKPAAASALLSPAATAGGAVFQRNCAFCHGRDAAGGETGPDLTRSQLVADDKDGDKISEVVRNGRPEKKMPAFELSAQENKDLVTFIHEQAAIAKKKAGGRRGVDVSDLQTGNVEAGRRYFNGAGTCSTCHSPTGDLSGIATRLQGLQLEEQMLYPRNVKDHVTVTLPSGETISGVLAYLDEFTVGLTDSQGTYHSWPTARVHYTVKDPEKAHAELFSKYTDDDIHNLMAFLQTLR